MKIREGFVSNSSSTSFVIIDASSGHKKLKGPLVFGDKGVREFGWGPQTLIGMHSRINFAYIQTYESPERLKMLEDVIHEHSGLTEPIVWHIALDYEHSNNGERWGYIDHQSAACEGKNLEMFESKKVLKDFLFGVHSQIILDNDNRC